MKRIWKALPALLLAAALLAGTARGADEASLAALFRQDGACYGFLRTEELPEQLRLLSGELSVPVKSQPQRLRESGLPVSYLLLVDCSTSMQNLWGRVRSFTAALAEADPGARFSLATFGEAFSLEWDGAAEEGDIVTAVSSIHYTAERTDLSQGILDAVDYLAGRPRRAGELVNLVVITDGVPKYSEGPSLEEAALILEEETSILVHTCGLSTGSGESAQAIESLEALGRGGHWTAEGSGSARSRGKSLAEFVGELCLIRFPWGDQNQGNASVFLVFGEGDEQELPVDLSALPVLGTASELPEDPEPPEVPEAPDTTEDPESPDEAVPPDGTDAPEDTDTPEGSDAPEDPDTPNDPDAAGDPDGPGDPAPSGTDIIAEPEKPGVHWAVWAAAGAAIPLALLVIAAVVLLRRRRRGAASGKEGIFMRLEVISGDYAGSEELYLTDELIIGRGGKCHIPWRDREMAPRSARVFLRDNMICIEDLGSPQGTALGGMRLHGPNRLRSGDEISIGTVRFRLKF